MVDNRLKEFKNKLADLLDEFEVEFTAFSSNNEDCEVNMKVSLHEEHLNNGKTLPKVEEVFGNILDSLKLRK